MTLYTHPGKNLNISEGGGDDPMGSSSSPSDQNNNEKKGAVVVVDFFAHDKTKQLPSSSSSAPLLFDDPPPHLNVNLGLNLIATLGCGGDGATVNAEHLLSDNGKHKQATTVDDGQEVVKRMKVEKQELQAKLREWKSKYENLEMQCEAYAWQQRQKQHAPLQLKGAEMVVTKSFAPNNLATTDDQPTATTTNTSPPCRVAVRTLPEGPAMVDGFYWRKYGQKMEKGKPHPRAYYKCTMQAGCPVRKQVQRSWEVDKEILITTYEGEHNHAVAGEAMAMVSTTTSAVRMFMTGAMSSSDGKVMMMNPNWLAGPINPTSNVMPIKLSAMKPFPTVSLDLTGTANSYPYPYPYHLHNKSQFSGLHLSPHHHHAAGSSSQPPPAQQHLSFHDVTAAAAAIINSDPSFSAMIAAAVSSITSAAQPNNNNSSQQ